MISKKAGRICSRRASVLDSILGSNTILSGWVVGQQSSLQKKIISNIELVVDRYLQTVSRLFFTFFSSKTKNVIFLFWLFLSFYFFMVIAETYQLTFVHRDVEWHWASQALQLFTKASLDSSVFWTITMRLIFDFFQ